MALDQLGASSAHTVFIGDSMQADIMPAKELGMYTILKSKDHSYTGPDAISDDLFQLPTLINRLSGMK
ncbi:HAD hydrolase-like protein [Paenibacillus sp. MMS18-CY102]|nr:HAD hydrolase-like protein [Paenibacillus sp. MMS18-CY102]